MIKFNIAAEFLKICQLLHQVTSLHLAARQGHLGVVIYLVAKRADINIQDNEGVSK